jgi:hypothetical protein
MSITVTIVANDVDHLHSVLNGMLPGAGPVTTIGNIPLQELLMQVSQRCEAEGYEMEAWKIGERETTPVNPSSPAERKKAEARAKLRGELVASLAEATHATSAVREEIENDVVPETNQPDPETLPEANGSPEQAGEDTPTAPAKVRKTRSKAVNGSANVNLASADETPDARKARIILRLQELYSGGRKADVNKLLAQFGNGTKTFSSIPAEQFGPIAEAVDAL